LRPILHNYYAIASGCQHFQKRGFSEVKRVPTANSKMHKEEIAANSILPELLQTLDIGRDTAYNSMRGKDFPYIMLAREHSVLSGMMND